MSDLTEFVTKRLKNPEGEFSVWGKPLLDAYARVSRLSFLSPVTWSSNRDYIFYGSRIFNKMTHEGRRNSHLVLSARDPFRLNEFPTSFSYDLKSYREVYSAIQHQDPRLLNDLQSRISKIIQKVKPKIFVANSTIDPINRLWLKTARASGVETACLQHGVYAQETPDYALEEDIVDKYIALDENQATIIRRNIAPEKILLLGERSSFEWNPPGNGIKICFVGEDWERYGYADLKGFIIKCYLEIINKLRERGVKLFFYKPHPSEENFFGIDEKIPKLKRKDIDKPDVYIGFSSSFLKDMSSRGKLAIQILENQTKADDFFKSGYCMSIPNDQNLIASLIIAINRKQAVPCIRERCLEELFR